MSRMPIRLAKLRCGRSYLRKFFIYVDHLYVQNLIEFLQLLEGLVQLRDICL